MAVPSSRSLRGRDPRQRHAKAPWAWIVYGVGVALLAAVAFVSTYALRTAGAPPTQRATMSGAVGQPWWRPGPLDSACVSGVSPADMIYIVHQLGAEPKVTEHRTLVGDLASVEVDAPSDQDEAAGSVIFYRERSTCEAGRAPNRPVPQDYN